MPTRPRLPAGKCARNSADVHIVGDAHLAAMWEGGGNGGGTSPPSVRHRPLIMPSGFSLWLIIQVVLYRRLTRHAPNIDSYPVLDPERYWMGSWGITQPLGIRAAPSL